MFKWIKDKFKGNKAENIEEIDLKEDIVENIDESIEENTEEVGIDSVDETSNFIAIEDYKEEIEEPTSVDDLNEVLEEVEEKPKFNLFKKLKDGLSKTRQEMTVKINTILGAYVKIDDELLEDLEDILISADIGMETTMKLIDNLRETIIQEKINDPSKVIPLLKEEIKKL
ncbi:cell division protein FtsY [Peptoniphilus indolicus ATCC 29427]|uniref:Cell division protein FtsY n=1 Tax=Peptoniphilus indolicus ATCC 29427 TaxID=997350 RepID=G4D5V7_9FIRM|nr:signal recognition particle receptor subunit alpha [Peptoniphilus indolicus]EGY78146.1 cell division protein FtsY [Peptoniphilus indolicus ATCC 29427]